MKIYRSNTRNYWRKMETINYLFARSRNQKNKQTSKVLIQQLRELEQDGIITRTVFNQLPPKVEYSMTDYELSVNPIIDVMCAWGKENISLRKQQGEEIELLKDKENFNH